jgi:hypothetical protein
MDTIEKIMANIPVPKTKKSKKKTKVIEPEPIEPTSPNKKKKVVPTGKKSDIPEYLPMLYGEPESIQETTTKAVSWQ